VRADIGVGRVFAEQADPRVLQFLRAQQAADMFGAKRRGAGHDRILPGNFVCSLHLRIEVRPRCRPAPVRQGGIEGAAGCWTAAGA